MRRITFQKNETIFAEGDPSERAYRIESGQVEILTRRPGVASSGKSKPVATLGPGEIFGEMSVIETGPRSATAVALEATTCVAFTGEEVMDLLASEPDQALDVIRTLIRRLRSANLKNALRNR